MISLHFEFSDAPDSLPRLQLRIGLLQNFPWGEARRVGGHTAGRVARPTLGPLGESMGRLTTSLASFPGPLSHGFVFQGPEALVGSVADAMGVSRQGPKVDAASGSRSCLRIAIHLGNHRSYPSIPDILVDVPRLMDDDLAEEVGHLRDGPLQRIADELARLLEFVTHRVPFSRLGR